MVSPTFWELTIRTGMSLGMYHVHCGPSTPSVSGDSGQDPPRGGCGSELLKTWRAQGSLLRGLKRQQKRHQLDPR